MIDKDHPSLSIAEQCRLLLISRAAYYYAPKGETVLNLALMRLIDEQFLETPFYGVRQMTWHLRAEGHLVNEKRIRRFDAVNGPDADLSGSEDQHQGKGPQDMAVSAERPEDRLAQSVLVFRRDLHSDAARLPVSRCDHGLGDARKVLAWRLSNTLEADFCVEALNQALTRFGPPDIMNTDQGSQITSWAWIDRLRKAGVKISMDGKGCFLDNIFVERLWRSLKYECVYLHAWSG